MYNGFSKVTIVVSLEEYHFNKGSKLTDKSALVYSLAEHNQLKLEKGRGSQSVPLRRIDMSYLINYPPLLSLSITAPTQHILTVLSIIRDQRPAVSCSTGRFGAVCCRITAGLSPLVSLFT